MVIILLFAKFTSNISLFVFYIRKGGKSLLTEICSGEKQQQLIPVVPGYQVLLNVVILKVESEFISVHFSL